jgi:Domain of unknown function (DUF222)
VVETLDDHALLNLAERVLAALGARPLGGAVNDAALAESVERLHRLETVAAAEKLRRVAEVDVRGVWRAEGARSTAELLAQRLRLTRGEARAQTETAIGLEGLLDGVGPISSATAQLLGCDAETTQVFMSRNGAVLDAGRTRREPTRAQRVAVIARDQTCVGCGAPASRCQIHRPRQPPPPAHPKGPVIWDRPMRTTFA